MARLACFVITVAAVSAQPELLGLRQRALTRAGTGANTGAHNAVQLNKDAVCRDSSELGTLLPKPCAQVRFLPGASPARPFRTRDCGIF
jgi:hypothetical protein